MTHIVKGDAPKVFSIELAWQSNTEKNGTIADTLKAVAPNINACAHLPTCFLLPPSRRRSPHLHVMISDQHLRSFGFVWLSHAESCTLML